MAEKKKGSKSFVLSSEGINSYGFRILTSGGDLAQFQKNPVMLFNHVRWGSDYNGPVGKWLNIRQENNQWIADSDFDLKDAKADILAGKVDDDYLKAASFGIKILELSSDPAMMLEGQEFATVTKWKAIEASICDIPSNDDSLVLYDQDDKVIDLTSQAFFSLFTPTNNFSHNKKSKMEFKRIIISTLSLDSNADDATVAASLQNIANENKLLKSENADLKEKQTKALAANIDAMVQLAVDSKKIKAEDKVTYVELATANFEATKKALESITPVAAPVNLAQALVDAAKGGENSITDKSKWSFSDWSKNDYDGLMEMKRNAPEKYKALCTAAGITI